MQSPTVLVLGSGGAKGMAILGALDFYYTHGYLTTVNEYWGTSIGGTIAFLLLLGYSPYKIFYKFFTTDTFANGVLDLETTIAEIGLCPIESIGQKLREFISDKLDYVPTFRELFRVYPKKLNIITTNVDTAECVVFNVDTFPEISVIEAIEISSNIPLLFTRKVFRGHQYTDGALINEFPIDLAGGKMKPDDFMLGVCTQEESIDNWISKLLSVQSRELYRRRLQQINNSQAKILELVVSGTQMTDLTPSKRKKVEVYSKGYQQARDSMIEEMMIGEGDGWVFSEDELELSVSP